MNNISLNPLVLVIATIALFITGLSIYISRVYLPEKIRRAYRKSITALAAAVETKDSGTVGHAQRVAKLTVDVARRAGVSGRDLERIEYAALLMDIGKANVPQSILKKTEPLTQDEWEIIKSHPRLGSEMVKAIPYLADTADYIDHHHEYWDGSGYPDALAKDKIPMGSRILCIAADYDAMVSDRPYHPRPLTRQEALEEIERGAGTKYDPVVAQIFIEMVWTETSEEESIIAA